MLQPPDNKSQFSSNLNASTTKAITLPTEQATIGRSLVIKGEVSGSESLFIDGRIEGQVNLADARLTVGRNGVVNANITAREVVIMGTVTGNVQCTDRLDLRNEGSLTGDVVTQRISVEDGAVLKGSVQVRATDTKNVKAQTQPAQAQSKVASPTHEQPKAAAATAGA